MFCIKTLSGTLLGPAFEGLRGQVRAGLLPAGREDWAEAVSEDLRRVQKEAPDHLRLELAIRERLRRFLRPMVLPKPRNPRHFDGIKGGRTRVSDTS